MDVRKLSDPSHSVLTRDKPTYLDYEFYKITLGPGDVRYLQFDHFFRKGFDVEKLIDEIRNAASGPVVKIESCGTPRREMFGGTAIDYGHEVVSLLINPEAQWDECLRVQHVVYWSFYKCGLCSSVYVAFHRHLRLDRHFAAAECAEAWVRETYRDDDLARSFLDSPDHIVIKLTYSSQYAVFKKTSFVKMRLDAIFDAERQARVAEETKHAEEQEERLRRSRFTTFVYIMEDTRNKTFKIGRSKTPGKRERTLQSEVPETVLRFSIPAGESHEITLHERFQHRRVRGEWFELSAEDLVETINYLKAEGDAERATVDFEWLGILFFRTRRAVL